jgi:hypothetical protein
MQFVTLFRCQGVGVVNVLDEGRKREIALGRQEAPTVFLEP